MIDQRPTRPTHNTWTWLLLSAVVLSQCGSDDWGVNGQRFDPAATYAVSGRVSGLSGNLVIAINGATRTVSNNGDLIYIRAIQGQSIELSIDTQPLYRTCQFDHAGNKVLALMIDLQDQDITHIDIVCTINSVDPDLPSG